MKKTTLLSEAFQPKPYLIMKKTTFLSIVIALWMGMVELAAQSSPPAASLINITTLEQLDAIRYDLDGEPTSGGRSAYETAFSLASGANNTCTDGCQGYELMNDLDFTGSAWAEGGTIAGGWVPIGDNSLIDTSAVATDAPRHRFTTTFEGNERTISKLYINTSTIGLICLFGIVGVDNKGTPDDESDDQAGKIRNLGLKGGSVKGSGVNTNVGGLVGYNFGTISACYATGNATGGAAVGGLVGVNNGGTISACYATGNATGGDDAFVGGLAGGNISDGKITACYATGNVAGGGAVGGLVGGNDEGTISACYTTGNARGGADTSVGGLVGFNSDGTISASYFNTQISGRNNGIGRGSAFPATDLGKTTTELQEPTAYTGIYSAWNVDIDNADGDNDVATGGDDPWYFGTSRDYPRFIADVFGLTEVVPEVVSLYPNPASDGVYVSGLETIESYIYELHSLFGQKVAAGQLSEDHRIDLDDLTGGTYVLLLRSKDGEVLLRNRLIISK